MTLRRIRAPLLRWYRRRRRDLPWRRTTDPYAIWVSEVMLQQTRVATVVPYWERFLSRLPDVASLAAAPEETVLGLWSGLGYYRRARALREGAAAIVVRHGGKFPRDPEALEALPGIGRYTAGAIASTAFGVPAPLVDGNVRRVFARYLAVERLPDRKAWEIAAELVEGPSPGDWNQALMELGATVCTPRAPGCPVCPLRRTCAGLAAGDPMRYPAGTERRPTTSVSASALVVVRRGRILLERRGEATPLRGAWDVPARVGDDVAAAVAREQGLRLRGIRPVGKIRHAILDRRLTIRVLVAEASAAAKRDAIRWESLGDLAEAPVSGATRKIVRAAGIAHGRSQGGTQRSSSSGAGSSPSSGRSKRYDRPSRSGTAPKARSSPAQ